MSPGRLGPRPRHDDTCQRYQAEHRHPGDVQVHDDVPPDRTDETEGDGAHDNEGLDVGLERNSQQREDHEQRRRC